MDTYLPADYLAMRDELDDWRDAPLVRNMSPVEPKKESDRDDPDPSWQVL